MKFFDRWLHKKMKYCWENSKNLAVSSIEIAHNVPSRLESLNAPSTNFRIFRANGGYIVEINTTSQDYNHSNYGMSINATPSPENPYKLYIIKDDEDLGTELGKIITFEKLRN